LSTAAISEKIQLSNQYWDVEIGVSDHAGPYRVVDRVNGLVVADEDYCYKVTTVTGSHRHVSQGVTDVVAMESLDERGQHVVLEGRFQFAALGPTDIGFRHRITLPTNGEYLEEQVALVHVFGPDEHTLEDLRFGFRKIVFDRERTSWRDRADTFSLIPIPHRRRFGHKVDRHLEQYTAADIFPQSWDPMANLPGFGSEAWAWTDGETGIVIAKYNPRSIEFSLFDGEMIVAGGNTVDIMEAVASHTPVPVNTCARFGGIGLYRGDPEFGQQLNGRVELEFGLTRMYSYRGGWQEAYRVYRDHLRSLGHVTPAGFDAPLHWNELYNLGWRLGDNAPLQTRAQLEVEAALAADVGAEALYLDPTWDIAEGTTIWDAERLGPQVEFVEMLTKHGLKLSLHLMMHTTKLDEDPRFYFRDQDGDLISFMNHRDVIYPNVCVCCASDVWKQAKIARLRALADAGATFFMFDFLSYARGKDRETTKCYDPTHGHAVPLTRQEHADSLLEVIQAVKQTHPQVVIEAHDRINGGLQDYHPLYFQHGLPDSFDSNWGFEYMWDPYYDLLSGKALSLYEYNLAYDIPLYLHIHEGRDSETMLAFWWYASTCRHLGIGGVSDPATPLYQALKRAVTKYRELKRHFSEGEFIGIDVFTHVHVVRDEDSAVAVLFNLTGEPVVRDIELSAERLGLSHIDSVSGAEFVCSEGQNAILRAEIAPLSPLLVNINTVSQECDRRR
jgi:hypothetical protein